MITTRFDQTQGEGDVSSTQGEKEEREEREADPSFPREERCRTVQTLDGEVFQMGMQNANAREIDVWGGKEGRD